MHVTQCDRRALVFAVEELKPFKGWSQGSFCVRLSARACDCGVFQSFYFSCHHALAACATVSVEWAKYVHPVYMQEPMFEVYKIEFSPIPDKKL
ncbi:hypothetical protein Ahy_B07g086476 [Arachis hypogaea]|uniref:SWIM-type domain-containing protein n=1 Tax=Arachis hypogaea TaxID=3818 RepID=A0A444Y9U3_ARAHY|nr:hypothetical protein Ahy_B07g086476 [Arachis hypogaea]